jgi:hypothetical protein
MKVSEYTVLQIVGLDAAVASLPHNAYAKILLTCKTAPQLFQDILLPLFRLLFMCCYGPYAH